MCESGIFSRGYLKIYQDTNLICRVTGKDRVLTAKPQGLLVPLSMADRGARVVQIAGGQGRLGFDQGAELKEGIEGVSKMCSPRAEIDGDGRRSMETARIGEERTTDGACSSISTGGTPTSIRRHGWSIGGRLDEGILVAAPACSSGGAPKQRVEAVASSACGCPRRRCEARRRQRGGVLGHVGARACD
jgi:hypothetical protein